jgi:hypothetical protein
MFLLALKAGPNCFLRYPKIFHAAKLLSLCQSCSSGRNLFTAAECGAKTWQAAALFPNTSFELLQAKFASLAPAPSELKRQSNFQTSALQLIREKVKPVYTLSEVCARLKSYLLYPCGQSSVAERIFRSWSIVCACASIINTPDPISLSCSPTTLRHLAGASREVI